MKRAARFLLMIPALFPAGCHYAWTAPALWSHNSSAAFEAWLFGWVIAVLAPFWVLVWASSERRKPVETTQD